MDFRKMQSPSRHLFSNNNATEKASVYRVFERALPANRTLAAKFDWRWPPTIVWRPSIEASIV
jgi:hypothetical protein